MKRMKLSELTGNEILAQSLMTWDYQIILPEGAVLKKEYIDKIEEMGILEVYVKEDEANEIVILKNDIEKTIRSKVKSILERHTYQNNKELQGLTQAADEIITNILDEKEVVEKVFDIKERSADIYEHSISLSSLAILTALRMNVDKQVIHDIGVGCLLHDIGLRYTTLDYEGKSMEDMKPEALAEYKKHPVYGYTSVKDEEWISDEVKKIILYHHERLERRKYKDICDLYELVYEFINSENNKSTLKRLKGAIQRQEKQEDYLESERTYKRGDSGDTD